MLRMIASLLIAYAIINYMDVLATEHRETAQTSGYANLLNATPYERCLANFGHSEQVRQCEVLNLAETF